MPEVIENPAENQVEGVTKVAGKRGRTPDSNPNKVLIPSAGNVTRNPDGSLTQVVPFNDAQGVRHAANVTLAVKDGQIVLVSAENRD